MKKKILYLIIMVSFFTTSVCTHRQEMFTCYLQKTAHLVKKHAFLLAMLPLIVSYQKNIDQGTMHTKALSSLFFYCLLHYSCDCVTHYQEQASMLHMIDLLKKISLYLVIAHGIKNYMQQKHGVSSTKWIAEDFLPSITSKLDYSFDEITMMTMQNYQTIKTAIESLNDDLKIESESFVFLCYAPSINLSTLLYLVQDNDFLYTTIHELIKDSDVRLPELVQYVQSEVTKNYIEFQRHAITHNQAFCKNISFL